MRRAGTKKVPYFCLSVFLFLTFIFFGTAFSQQDNPAALEEKLAELSAEEKKILEELFTLTQAIETMEKEKEKASLELEDLQRQIDRLEAEMAAEEETYRENREALKHVLRSYQRTGPYNYLERIMKAKSFSDFLRRLGTLRDLARNTGKLLEKLQESMDKLVAQKQEQEAVVASLQAAHNQLTEAIAKSGELKAQLESSLAALAEERELFEERLAIIERSWQELAQFFPELSARLDRVIKEAELPPEAVKLTITPAGVKAAVTDDTLNNLLAGYGFSGLQFAFAPGKVKIEVPEKSLVLAGIFLVEDQVLKFQAQEGTFYGMPLSPAKLEELFAAEELRLDLSQLVGEIRILDVEIKEGQLELTVVPL